MRTADGELVVRTDTITSGGHTFQEFVLTDRRGNLLGNYDSKRQGRYGGIPALAAMLTHYGYSLADLTEETS